MKQWLVTWLQRFIAWLSDPVVSAISKHCPRCRRPLVTGTLLAGSPLCYRCTLHLAVPRSLGLERDRLLQELPIHRARWAVRYDDAVKSFATGAIHNDTFNQIMQAIAAERDAYNDRIVDVDRRIQEALTAGLQAAVDWK